jgi:epoxyqueuosine reductase
LRGRLLALGFDAVRFARIETGAAEDALRAWLDAGHHAGMDWIARGFEKRKNPGLALPGAKSAILLGVNYNPGAQGGGALRWARYAQFADYHDTIKPALARAGRALEEKFAITADDYRYYADTGPVLERAWAARAGLGFIGKNAMLVSRDFGNWLFLAAIFVRAEIPPDEPLAGGRFRLCGKCARCMAACPAGAITRAGVVDSRLCIAYQTIENRGVIPRELREKIGARIFGCDVCAEACPWNRFARKNSGALLDARPGRALARLSLRDVLTLTPGKFATVFRGTAIKRVKLAGLLRNACVVAGNLGECVAELAALAGHAAPLVRAHAVWAVHKITGRKRALELLREPRAAETDPIVLRESP